MYNRGEISRCVTQIILGCNLNGIQSYTNPVRTADNRVKIMIYNYNCITFAMVCKVVNNSDLPS